MNLTKIKFTYKELIKITYKVLLFVIISSIFFYMVFSQVLPDNVLAILYIFMLFVLSIISYVYIHLLIRINDLLWEIDNLKDNITYALSKIRNKK